MAGDLTPAPPLTKERFLGMRDLRKGNQIYY